MKLKKCSSWISSDYLFGIIHIKIPWCHKKSIIFFSIFRALFHIFFACVFVWTKMEAASCMHHGCSCGIWLKLVKNKDQYSRPFSQARNAGNEVAIFHPGHKETRMGNFRVAWKTCYALVICMDWRSFRK